MDDHGFECATLLGVKTQDLSRVLLMTVLSVGCSNEAVDSDPSGCTEWAPAQMLNNRISVPGERCFVFSTDHIGEIAITVRGATTSGTTSIIQDKNGNAILDDTSLVHVDYVNDDAIFTTPLPAGTYFLDLKFEGTLNLTAEFTPYALPEIRPDPGAVAREAATLENPASVRTGGYVGALDDKDLYRFHVAQPSSFVFELQDEAEGLDTISMTIHADRNGNQLLEADEFVAQKFNGPKPLSGCAEPGDYVISVFGGEGLYTLSGGVSPAEDSAICGPGPHQQ